jgi:hypothetical protein
MAHLVMILDRIEAELVKVRIALEHNLAGRTASSEAILKGYAASLRAKL